MKTNPAVQATGVIVWRIFSWHSLGPIVSIKKYLNTSKYLDSVADHVPYFMTTVHPSSGSHFQRNVSQIKNSGRLE